MTKPSLIILSDLWGADKSEWLLHYTRKLEAYFDITFHDSYVLAGFKAGENLQEIRHHHFVNGGVEKAVENILLLEKQPIIVLGFSVGGTIAWKAALGGLCVTHLFAVSSTRLRYEKNKPATEINLFYGAADEFKPNADWFATMHVKYFEYPKEPHEMYRKLDIAGRICDCIIAQVLHAQ